jgi:hypothetical protein
MSKKHCCNFPLPCFSNFVRAVTICLVSIDTSYKNKLLIYMVRYIAYSNRRAPVVLLYLRPVYKTGYL